MVTPEDLVNACFEQNYVKVIKILNNLEKTEYLEDIIMDCFIGSMRFLHQDLLIRFLDYDERLALEYFEHYDIFVILYTLELGLDKLSNKIFDILHKYDNEENKKDKLKLKYNNEKYKELISHTNTNDDNILQICIYSSNSKFVDKILELKSYGTIDFSHTNNYDQNALMLSINNNMLKTAHKLLEYYDEKTLNYINKEGYSVFLYSVVNKQYDFMTFLMEYDKCNVKYDATCYYDGKNALHYLCIFNEMMYSVRLITKCPELIYCGDYSSSYPLLYALKGNMNFLVYKILKLMKHSIKKKFIIYYPNNNFECVDDYLKKLSNYDKLYSQFIYDPLL